MQNELSQASINRLNKLIDHLENKVEDKDFDAQVSNMGVLAHAGRITAFRKDGFSTAKKTSQTDGRIAGLTYYADKRGIEAGAEYFGIPYDDAVALFGRTGNAEYHYMTNKFRRSEIIKGLRYYVANGHLRHEVEEHNASTATV